MPNQIAVELPSGSAIIELDYQTFDDALAILENHADKLVVTEQHFRTQLNVPFVHPQIRTTTLALMGG